MSWFYHVSHGSTQQQEQQLADMMPATATASLSGTYYSRIRGPTGATQAWPGCSSPSLDGLPAAPRGAVPPSLENLSCTSLSASPGGEPEPISYVTLQEQRCVLSWFLGWTPIQRERFLQDLLGKAVPGKVCTLLDSLNTLQVKDSPPNIFECQLRLWTQWFESWSEEERNRFLHILEERDPVFVAHFYRSVAGTAGRD
ncbi:uncharacterized protein C14orf119 homolog [Centroberyx affinis]|uniref:uncharacterized protein C14orf119 homolog n=1 Tax=Centroberyx affinis TaxID=166261 RepID=UPI003A5C4857